MQVLEECLRRAIAADGSSSVIGVPGITEQYDNSADDFNDLNDETKQAETIPQETSEVAADLAVTPPSSDGLKCITPESRAIILPTYYSHCSPLRKAKPTWILRFVKEIGRASCRERV